jgi:hypothetical protein
MKITQSKIYHPIFTKLANSRFLTSLPEVRCVCVQDLCKNEPFLLASRPASEFRDFHRFTLVNRTRFDRF